MVLTLRFARKAWVLPTLLVASLTLASSPTLAHKGEQHGAKASRGSADAPAKRPSASPRAVAAVPPPEEESRGEETSAGFLARLADWFGRLHPIVVHFPMAFLPAALFTAVAGRKRPAFAAPVQFLVVAGGLLAALSAALGWLNAGFALSTEDHLLEAHRWLGSFIGVFALALATWAARRPDRARSPAMIVGLSIITVAVLAQGWLGGALVHGADHLNW